MGSNQASGIESLYNEFLKLEDDLDLFSQKISSVHFWERIRNNVFTTIIGSKINQGSNEDRLHSETRIIKLGLLKLFAVSLLNIRRNPFTSRKKDVLFIGSRRRFLRDDGMWWDIYLDPIVDRFNGTSVMLERHDRRSHRTPAKTKNLRFLDFIDFLAYLRVAFRFARVSLAEDETALLRHIHEEVVRRFDVSFEINKVVSRILVNRKAKLPLLRVLLKRIRPKVAVLVTSYGKEDFIEACKSLGIPVIELQHGAIGRYHLAYSFEGKRRSKRTFPDYLLVFGDYWAHCAEYTIDSNHVISVGFPHFEREKNMCIGTEKKNQILFLSQAVGGETLSKFAVDLSKAPGFDYKIAYKLHPRECNGWQDRYPWLLDSGIEVIDTQESVLYKLFAESMAQVGLYSTALYEGLGFGLNTFLVDAGGAEYFNLLVKNGMVLKVSSVHELLDHLRKEKSSTPFDTEYFFKANALTNISAVLQKLVKPV